MRTLLAGLTTLTLGLATCLSASAQVERPDRDREQNRSDQGGQGERKTIRGVIAGVTIEGELAIDARTNRPATTETSFLTIVGSERPQARTRDGDAARGRDREARDAARDRAPDDRNSRDRQASSERERRRDNVYVIWLTPRTEIRHAGNRRGDRGRDEQNANRDDRNRGDRNSSQENPGANANRAANPDPLTLDVLELGDRVEVEFRPRNAAAENREQNPTHRKHGRHRTYFGEAVSIIILAEPGRSEQDRDGSNRERNRDRVGDQNNRNNDREQ